MKDHEGMRMDRMSFTELFGGTLVWRLRSIKATKNSKLNEFPHHNNIFTLPQYQQNKRSPLHSTTKMAGVLAEEIISLIIGAFLGVAGTVSSPSTVACLPVFPSRLKPLC